MKKNIFFLITLATITITTSTCCMKLENECETGLDDQSKPECIKDPKESIKESAKEKITPELIIRLAINSMQNIRKIKLKDIKLYNEIEGLLLRSEYSKRDNPTKPIIIRQVMFRLTTCSYTPTKLIISYSKIDKARKIKKLIITRPYAQENFSKKLMEDIEELKQDLTILRYEQVELEK